MWKILLIQGPNMSYLGRRQPELYGKTTAAELASYPEIFFVGLTTGEFNLFVAGVAGSGKRVSRRRA